MIATGASSRVPADHAFFRAFQNLPREHGFEPLRVEGRLPDDLVGTLYRNGPGLVDRFAEPIRWPDADGAVSAVLFGGGFAEGAVRLVRTETFIEETCAGRRVYGGLTRPAPLAHRLRMRIKNPGNTHVLHWQGRLFALYETDRPTELSAEDLTTLGETDLDGVVVRAFSAHYHRCPRRRATYNFGVRYTARGEPLVDLFELPDEGPARLLATHQLALGVIHDFIVTPRYLVLLAPPIAVRTVRYLLGRGSVYDNLVWDPARGTEVLIVPIDEPTRAFRFTVEPIMLWHYANAFERDGEVVVDYVRYPRFTNDRGFDDFFTDGSLHRLTLRPRAGAGRSVELSGRSCEFPRVGDVDGEPYRHAYVVAHTGRGGRGRINGLLRVDVETGRELLVDLGPQQFASEPVFAPRPGARREDDGYLLTQVYDAGQHLTHIAVLDAADLAGGPIARAWFDHHIPAPLHGVWVPRGRQSP